MSSRRIVARRRPDFGARHTEVKERAVAPANTPKKRGPRQPLAEDFQVTVDLPQALPILDRELRAIEILLGNDLRELIGDDGKRC